MKQAFDVSKDLKTGEDKLWLRIPLSAVKLLVEHLQTPLSEAEKHDSDGRMAIFVLVGSIIHDT